MLLKYIKWPVILTILVGMISCEKNFLDKKPDQALLVPETLSDFQSLLDNSNSVMNYTPYLTVIATDDIYTTDEGFTSQYVVDQNSYVWAPDIFQTNTAPDWNTPYQQVFSCNIVLDGISNISVSPETQDEYNQIRGTALFYRAFAFYNVAQEFAKPYVAATASQDLGIPLRLSSDVNGKSVRATLQQTYDQILSDLTLADSLLPVTVGFKTRPNKAAAVALMARVYQTMQDYTHAAIFANASLAYDSALIDYNTLDTSSINPLPVILPNGNDEVLFYAVLIYTQFISSQATLVSVDTTLYHSYDSNDLRKHIFFTDAGNNMFLFKGYYTGNGSAFAGIATDEIYLIRAESNARLGNTMAAMQDLNSLLQKRYFTGRFTARSATNADDALNQILIERRKELVYRNLRWTDLRRLNLDSRFAVTLERMINGQTYTLPPDDARYTFPIAHDVISLGGIQQNPR